MRPLLRPKSTFCSRSQRIDSAFLLVYFRPGVLVVSERKIFSFRLVRNQSVAVIMAITGVAEKGVPDGTARNLRAYFIPTIEPVLGHQLWNGQPARFSAFVLLLFDPIVSHLDLVGRLKYQTS
jgi:hypothetical protein